MASDGAYGSPGSWPEPRPRLWLGHLPNRHSSCSRTRNTGDRRTLTLDTVEQERILNELVVAHLVLIILVLEAPDLRVPSGFRDHLARLKEHYR